MAGVASIASLTAIRREHRFRVGDPMRLVARAARFEVLLERVGGLGERRRGLKLREAVLREGLEFVPDEVEL
jgi:hypothetical protein